MTLPVRAVYEHGSLRLLDPVNLAEGQQIQLLILSEREQAQSILNDLLVQLPDSSEESIDEKSLLREIIEGFQGASLSDAIIQERDEGL